jgi:hypothetical protein
MRQFSSKASRINPAERQPFWNGKFDLQQLNINIQDEDHATYSILQWD